MPTLDVARDGETVALILREGEDGKMIELTPELREGEGGSEP